MKGRKGDPGTQGKRGAAVSNKGLTSHLNTELLLLKCVVYFF